MRRILTLLAEPIAALMLFATFWLFWKCVSFEMAVAVGMASIYAKTAIHQERR